MLNPISLMTNVIPNAKERIYTVSSEQRSYGSQPVIDEQKTINWKQGLILIAGLGVGIWFLNKQASKYDEEIDEP